MADVNVVSLKCPNCGAILSVAPNAKAMSCKYCGAEATVERSGGAVSLHALSDAMARVEQNTAKSAAELARPRLAAELAAARQERSALHATATRQEDDYAARAAAAAAGTSSGLVVAAVLGAAVWLVSFAALGLAYLVLFNLSGTDGNPTWYVRATQIFAVAPALGTVLLSRRRSARKRRESVAVIETEARIAAQMHERGVHDLDARVATAEKRVAENRAILDA